MPHSKQAQPSFGKLRASNPAGSSESSWYVAAAKPNRELHALEHLRNQEFEVFLPLMRRTIRSGRRMINRREAYFPGYALSVSILPIQAGGRSIPRAACAGC